MPRPFSAPTERLAIHHRQRAGHADAHRTGLRIRRLAELRAAPAEHLALGEQLHVNFQADDDGIRLGHGGGATGIENYGLVAAGGSRRLSATGSSRLRLERLSCSRSGYAFIISSTRHPFRKHADHRGDRYPKPTNARNPSIWFEFIVIRSNASSSILGSSDTGRDCTALRTPTIIAPGIAPNRVPKTDEE